MRLLGIIQAIFCILCSVAVYAQDTVTLYGQVLNASNAAVPEVTVQIPSESLVQFTDPNGKFQFVLEANRSYELLVTGLNITTVTELVTMQAIDKDITLSVIESAVVLPDVSITSDADAFGIRQLRAVENGGLYEGKKTEVISIDRLVSNKAGNNARQAFAKIPNLNIWESDNAGLQLDIGGRGLSPKRTSNFNTRQNGYDMSADALGYPESYYTPPLQAVDRVELVRGAGALQYGSQFGGMVNFRLKEGNSDKKVNFESENTYGANQFFNTFNSLHGQVGKLNYYSYVQYKRGEGWRDNSDFEQVGGYFSGKYQANEKLSIGVDLTDKNFLIDPTMSNRERNWFRVKWNLAALLVEYKFSDKVKLYNRLFGLAAQRTSLGLLETPNLPDPMSNRDLLDGQFRNIGNETRLSISYDGLAELNNTLLVGSRIYRGNTNFSQQFGSDGFDADFTAVDTTFIDRRTSDYDFPNTNIAVFAENIFRLSNTFSLVPGVRFEYIDTESDGVFTKTTRTNAFGDFIVESINDSSDSKRYIFLYGLGLSHKFSEKYELYGNATTNYRAINFTDVQIQSNIQIVDPDIQDESGYTFDLGLRRRSFSPFFIETGVFYINYGNRIGEVIDDGVRVRTNIGSANIIGYELYLELDVMDILKKKNDHSLSTFINGSINRGVYTDINDRALVGVRSGNRLEELPNYNVKTGINYGYKSFAAAVQSTWVGSQFSDAANTVVPFEGVWGEIPAYHVMDVSIKYDISDKLHLSASVNNALNNYYFTRRATAYPGPGIIPALGRTWNVTVGVKL
jgi:Fe(3+) dicitrate transport protein